MTISATQRQLPAFPRVATATASVQHHFFSVPRDADQLFLMSDVLRKIERKFYPVLDRKQLYEGSGAKPSRTPDGRN